MDKHTYIIVSDKNIKHLLPLEDILHISSARIYSIFYMRNSARQYIASQSLGKIYQQLKSAEPAGAFLRIHKSHIVNLREVSAYKNARGGEVTLSDNTIITVAQRRKTELLRYLNQLNKKEKKQPRKIKPAAQIDSNTLRKISPK